MNEPGTIAAEVHPGLTGDVPDYTTMSDGDMVTALGDDAMKWSVAFCQMARKLGHHGIDEGWMLGWFASAIEHSNNVRRWRKEESMNEQGTIAAVLERLDFLERRVVALEATETARKEALDKFKTRMQRMMNTFESETIESLWQADYQTQVDLAANRQ